MVGILKFEYNITYFVEYIALMNPITYIVGFLDDKNKRVMPLTRIEFKEDI